MPLDPQYDLDDASYGAWLDLQRDLREKLCSPRYLQGLGETLAQAGRACGGDLIGADRAQLTAYLTGVGQAHSAGTANKRYRDLRRFYRWAAEEGLVDASPVARIPAPRPDHAAPPVLTTADLDALVRACDGKGWRDLRDKAIILLWCEIGSPRCSEAAGLGTGDVDMRHDQVRLMGKGRRERWVPLGPATARAFSRYARARAQLPRAAEHQEFFLGRKGPLTRWGLRLMLNRRWHQAGFDGDIHPHMFRHAATIRAQNKGIPDRAIAYLNGWSSTAMCSVYGRAAAAVQAGELARAAGMTAGLGSGRAS